MPQKQQRLDQFVTVIVPGSGDGFSLPFGPTRYLEEWKVTLLSIQTAGNTSDSAEVFVYRGAVSPTNQVDYTQKVAGDTSNTDLDMMAGDTLIFEWRNCTPGAIGTAHIIGQQLVTVG
jgi:hypothetical protein